MNETVEEERRRQLGREQRDVLLATLAQRGGDVAHHLPHETETKKYILLNSTLTFANLGSISQTLGV